MVYQLKLYQLPEICEWTPTLFLDLRMKDNNEDTIQLNEIFGEVIKLVLKNLIPLMHIPLKKNKKQRDSTKFYIRADMFYLGHAAVIGITTI